MTGNTQASQALRRQAEETLRQKLAKEPKRLAPMSAEEIQLVLHELQVHQIELEIQNEELQRSQVELDATRARYFDLYDLAPIGYCTISEQGLFLEVNLTTATLLGINRGTLIGRRLSQSILKEDQDIYYLHRKLLVETGRLQTCELRMVKKDRTIFWAHLITTVDQDAEGKPLCRVILSDITARKFRDVEGELATLLTSQTKSSDKLRQCLANLTASLQNWSGCSAVGIRLRSGDDYPYYETRGFPPAFVQAENHLCAHERNGELLRDAAGAPVLECMCGNILCGRFDPAKPFFTDQGSFWSNNTTALLASTTGADRQARTRNRCNGEGYESVALIPLRDGNQVFGLLQFNDYRPDRFTLELITHFERMANILAITLSRRQAEDRLLENEAAFKAILNASPEAIFLMTTDGKVLAANQALASRLKIPNESLIGSNLYNYISPELAASRRYHVQRAIEFGKSYFFEDQRDSSFIEHNIIPILNEDGSVSQLAIFGKDITERKRMDEHLKIYHNIVSSTPEAIAFLDVQYRYVIINDTYERFTGVSREKFIGQTIAECLGEEVFQKSIKPQFDKCLQGEIVSFQEWFDHPTLGRRFVEVTYFPYRNLLHQPAGVVTTTRDITNRKRAADLLAARLRLSEAAVTLSLHDLLTLALDEAESLTESRIGFFHFFDDDQKTITLQAWSTATSGTFCKAEGSGLHYNLEAAGIWADCIRERRVIVHNDYAGLPHRRGMPEGHAPVVRELVAPVFRNARIVAIFAVGNKALAYTDKDIELVSNLGDLVWDIVIRKRAEEFLKENEERFRALSSLAPVGIYITSPDGQCQYVNPRWCEMAGLTREEALGEGWIAALHPDDRATVYGNWQQMVESEGRWGFEYRFQTPVGKTTWVFGLAAPQRDGTGRIVRYIGINTDITAKKQAEEDHAKLEAQNRQLQKAESLGVMAGAIAHHFNNKLGAVIGNIDMALDDLPQGAELHKRLTAAMQGALKAAEVSGQMLTYLGQTTGMHAPLDMSEVCRQGLPLLQAAVPPNIIFKVDLPSPGPTINTNLPQTQQVLNNLVTNAWEAIGEKQGTINLTIKTVTRTDIQTTHRLPIDWKPQNKAHACLEVWDTGCGIAAEDIDKVFDPFFSTKFTGRGLGLPVVLGIVKAHDGAITVESNIEHGCTFRVYLPLSAEEIPRQPIKTAQLLEREGARTVLLVDDEEMIREMAATMLMRMGYQVLTANDGVEALEVFKNHFNEISVVLSDLSMPRMGGWETLTAMRQIRPDIPVILASGHDESRVLSGYHSERPQVFLHKPYQKSELQVAIETAMGG